MYNMNYKSLNLKIKKKCNDVENEFHADVSTLRQLAGQIFTMVRSANKSRAAVIESTNENERKSDYKY